jgi:hypothetical protein
MPQDPGEGTLSFQSHVDAWDAHENLFNGLYEAYDEERASVSGLRRRRRRASNTPDNPIKTVSLIEEGGVLFWRDNIPVASPSVIDIGLRRRRLRRRAGLPLPPVLGGDAQMPDSPVVLTRTFPVLAPNKVVEAVGAIDRALNPALDPTLRSRLRRLQRINANTFRLDPPAEMPVFSGSTLLFVHGTFSNATNMLGEFTATQEGLDFLNGATTGAKAYQNVVFFEHATLAVSPIVNALELGRFFANAGGKIDVIAHSRGGLVVRWWLEGFGKSLSPEPAPAVRAVLVGSPLNGTSLAAPDKLKNVLSLLTNIGSFAEATLKLAGTANPFLWVGGKLVEVVVSVTGALANTPLVDGMVALVPGLSGQAKVSNNHEINRLRLGPCAVDPLYYAVQSNFETKVGWQFWKYFKKEVIADSATNWIFEGPNDLVVDTGSMTDLGGDDFKLKLAADPHDFKTNDKVWHCNYFRQPETIGYITAKFT